MVSGPAIATTSLPIEAIVAQMQQFGLTGRYESCCPAHNMQNRNDTKRVWRAIFCKTQQIPWRCHATN
jgi:hypothetical protein